MCEERGAYGSAANLCNKHIGYKHIGNKHIGYKRMANKHIANKQIGFSVSANLLIESRYSISILDISFDDGRQKPLAVFSCDCVSFDDSWRTLLAIFPCIAF